LRAQDRSRVSQRSLLINQDRKMGTGSRYEAERQANIEKNQAVLASLGLLDPVASGLLPPPKKSKPRPASRKRVRENVTPERTSMRAKKMPAPTYVPPSAEKERDDTAKVRKAQQSQGFRLADGKWRGERFGEVQGIEVGTVFGAGDYQRKGRFEMSENGFFFPHVQPEWLDPELGCYSLILNNDNGLSKDEGDRIVYAGSGGRMRGQNRSAPQSFDQSWDNLTNAALLLNHKTKRPVRVIRGPKLAGKHGTAKKGGGFRYDGLYHVTDAEMVPTGTRKLKTAMFTLERAK